MNNNYRNNNQQQKNTQAQKEDKMTISVDTIPFEGVLQSKITSTVELSKIANRVFKAVFADYEGSVILPNRQTGAFELSLYFKDSPAIDGKIKALEPIVGRTGRGDTPFQKINSLNSRFRNRTYSLTKEAKDILSDFMAVSGFNKNINWNQCVVEMTQQEYAGYSIYIKIINLDVNKLLKKVYGGRDKETGARIDYSIANIRPLGMGAGMNQNFLINIQQLNNKEVEEIVKKLGMVPTAGNLPIVR